MITLSINAVTLTGLSVSTNGKINTVSNAADDLGTVTTINWSTISAGNTTIYRGKQIPHQVRLLMEISLLMALSMALKTLTLQSGAGDIDISNLIGNSTALSTVAINTTTAVGNEATGGGDIAIAGVGKGNS